MSAPKSKPCGCGSNCTCGEMSHNEGLLDRPLDKCPACHGDGCTECEEEDD